MGPDRKGAILMIRMSILVAALFTAGSAIAQTAATAPSAKPMAPVAAPAHIKPAAATATAAPVDVNSATLEQLSTTKGLNKPLAEAIIKGRPYKSLDELTKNKIMSDEVFARVKDELTIRHQ